MAVHLHTPEHMRLEEDRQRLKNWKRWGPYLAERQWGTVREDYSDDGEAWTYFPFEQARSRAYRWGEDGLLGVTDREGRLCFALSLWNGRDPILKERLFGLTGPEGNHGEDVKEVYYYTANTPTHSHFTATYHYPHAEFPYQQLVDENRRRGRLDAEFELEDTGIFSDQRYFKVEIEYAKAGPDDLLIEVVVTNCGPELANLHLLPTLWFRNTWSWGPTNEATAKKPEIRVGSGGHLIAQHPTLGDFIFAVDSVERSSGFLFTENETNAARLFGGKNATPYVKDGFNDHLVGGQSDAVNPERRGTKAAHHEVLSLHAGERVVRRFRLRAAAEADAVHFGPAFDEILKLRRQEADQFFDGVIKSTTPAHEARVARQAYAGLLWSKQFYHYIVTDWLKGDPAQPAPPSTRMRGRNTDWPNLYSRDVISMPDKWEYPWFAAWDLAFHMIPMARVDPVFAKEQLNLILREWYMHPNGQIPAYEWNFSDVNPPVHAWACWRVYKMTGPRKERDRVFLARVFQKLLVNFTWWVNRKDQDGRHLFSGGFLGLDNIGVFDRSKPLPTGGRLEQADGTAWMAFYCGTMLAMALELAESDPVFEDIASKFFEHFVAIADAMNNLGGTGLWHEGDGFYYDRLRLGEDSVPLRLRSTVGLIPLFAVEFIEESRLGCLPGFAKRTRWFLDHRRELSEQISYLSHCPEQPGRRLLAIPSRDRLARVLAYLFDEDEFLSPFGIRSLSRVYEKEPFVLELGGVKYNVGYVPGESDSGLFGGNSNWRGPIWFPTNFLLIEALERYHHFYGETFRVEFPTRSRNWINLREASRAVAARLLRLFESPVQSCSGHCLFHEYYNPETGKGLGASHQTGWTALVAKLIEDFGEKPGPKPQK